MTQKRKKKIPTLHKEKNNRNALILKMKIN